MSWVVRPTVEAEQNLDAIHAYIRDSLSEPETVKKQIARIVKAFRAIDHFPLRHRVYDEEPYRSRGVRFFPVDNYLIFYHPNEATHIVEIIRIIYGARDLTAQLEHSASQSSIEL